LADNIITNFGTDEIQEVFDNYLRILRNRLNLDPLVNYVKLRLIERDIFETDLGDPLGLVERELDQNGRLIISISKKFKKFLPMILLREAYYCFLRDSLRNNVQIKFIIYILVELDLPPDNTTREWKERVRKIPIFSEIFSSQYDYVKKFLQFKYPNSEKTNISTLFHYLRALNIEISYEYLHRFLIRLHMRGLKKAYRENEDLLETVRVLDIIFQEVKSYRALLDYQKHFKKFKENGTLKTKLSLRNFISNVRWLSQYSFCSPIYILNWNSINLSFLYVHIRFHPTIAWDKIDAFLSQLPFNIISQFLPAGFSKEFFGYFIIPESYVKDLEKFLDSLKNMGYLVIADSFPILKRNYFANLNYFSESAVDGKFVPSFSRHFNEEFILALELEYKSANFISELSLLDFLILERARQLSFTGFGFERRESTLSSLKDDFLYEISRQNRIVSDIRFLLREISQNDEVRRFCLTFIKKGQDKGFFFIYNQVSQICSLNLQLKDLLNNKKKKLTRSGFINHINNKGLSSTLEKNLILKDSKLKAFLIQKLYPLYLNSPKQFNKEKHVYEILMKILEMCKELRIYDMHSIRNIIQKPSLIESVYIEKKEKIEKIYHETFARDITS